MAKFKVGDRVRAKHGEYTGYTVGSPYNLPRGEGVVSYSIPGSMSVEYEGIVSPPVNQNSFKLVTPAAGPIRTVTRREIVPGVYGGVNVQTYDDTRVTVFMSRTYNAAELREAARIFTEIADVLEDKES